MRGIGTIPTVWLSFSLLLSFAKTTFGKRKPEANGKAQPSRHDACEDLGPNNRSRNDGPWPGMDLGSNCEGLPEHAHEKPWFRYGPHMKQR